MENNMTTISELNRLTEELRAKAKKELPALITGIVPAHPRVTAVTWRQYAPNFNDGEPCEFTVHDFFLVLDDQEPDDVHYDYEQYISSSEMKEFSTPEEYSAMGELSKYLNDNAEVATFLFGPDSTVTIWKDPAKGIQKEDYYDHD
jgi:hypothetical protein